MSKRASINAIRFAGKRWRTSTRHATPILENNNSEEQKSKQKKLKENKKERIQLSKKSQFERICKKFDNNEPPQNIEKLFYSIKSNTVRLKAMQNVKTFKLYCKKYCRDYSITNYFEGEYYKTDFKKKYPDVYFYNVIKENEKPKNKFSKESNSLNEQTINRLEELKRKIK